MTAMRFGDRAATLANARLCYGDDAQEGEAFAVFADPVGWGWSALRPVPVRQPREHGRAGPGRPQRTHSAANDRTLQPAAKSSCARTT